MYFMYVDESGDPGIQGSPGRYFVLTGLVVHELRWYSTLQTLKAFRKRLRGQFGLSQDVELHASELINRPGQLAVIPKHQRLAILRQHAKEIGGLHDCSLVNVVVDKSSKAAGYDVFFHAWRALIQRFENTIDHGNFPGGHHPHDRGMILADDTDGGKLTRLLRRMRAYNPTPNQPQWGGGYRNLTLSQVVEDPVFRRSDFSYFIQCADTTAYLMKQRLAPNRYMRKKAGHRYYRHMLPAFCTVCSSAPDGVVYL